MYLYKFTCFTARGPLSATENRRKKISKNPFSKKPESAQSMYDSIYVRTYTYIHRRSRIQKLRAILNFDPGPRGELGPQG
jgi:hypothetical protein